MLKCRDVLALGSAYVDGAGSGRGTFALRAHLLVCGHCRRFIRSLRLTVRTAERLALPVDERRVREIVALIPPAE